MEVLQSPPPISIPVAALKVRNLVKGMEGIELRKHNVLAVQAFQGTLLEAAALGLWNSVVTIRKDKPTFEKLDQHTLPQGSKRQ